MDFVLSRAEAPFLGPVYTGSEHWKWMVILTFFNPVIFLRIINLFDKIHFFKDFIYLSMRDTQRETETQAEGEASSMQGARCGIRSRNPGITAWAKGRCSTTEPPRCPQLHILKKTLCISGQRLSNADVLGRTGPALTRRAVHAHINKVFLSSYNVTVAQKFYINYFYWILF